MFPFTNMLGLDSLAPLPQVQASFKETIKIVHQDKNNGVVVCGESQATQKLNDAFNVYKDAHDAKADNARLINQRPRAAAPSASSSRSIGQGQAAPDGSPPAAASGPAPQPQSHGPAQGSSAASVIHRLKGSVNDTSTAGWWAFVTIFSL